MHVCVLMHLEMEMEGDVRAQRGAERVKVQNAVYHVFCDMEFGKIMCYEGGR